MSSRHKILTFKKQVMHHSQKYTVVLFLVLTAFLQCRAQSDKPIIKLTYESSPVSQYFAEEHLKSTPTKASLYEFFNGITDHYSLYVKLEDRSSIYVLDSTTQVRPRGYERTRAALLDTTFFTLKSAENKTFKHEWIMNQIFYSEGEVGDIDWKLLPEQRVIDGLECYKAISENYPMLTVWYTKEVPVSNGPSIYQGLPGLIVYAEDYFRTIKLVKIEYVDNKDGFDELYSSKMNKFSKEKQEGEHYIIEPILLIKKGDLAKSSYKYFHKKPYRRDVD